MLVATANPTLVANENATVSACCFVRPRAAVVMKSPRMGRGTDVRTGDQDVAEALSRAGRFAVGTGAAVRNRTYDDLTLGQDGAAGPRPVGRFERMFAAAPGDAQARPLHGDHRSAPRGDCEAVGEAAVRRDPRGGLPVLPRCADRASWSAWPCRRILRGPRSRGHEGTGAHEVSRSDGSLSHLPCTLDDARCHTPSGTRYQPACSALAGRQPNPLDHDREFRFACAPLQGRGLAQGDSPLSDEGVTVAWISRQAGGNAAVIEGRYRRTGCPAPRDTVLLAECKDCRTLEAGARHRRWQRFPAAGASLGTGADNRELHCQPVGHVGHAAASISARAGLATGAARTSRPPPETESGHGMTAPENAPPPDGPDPATICRHRQFQKWPASLPGLAAFESRSKT